ncbi:MAG: MGMT family protein [Patescibacteria group bacterium]|jgi:methylated-DNA-[protein]-cysteine S-methyltransferase
MLKKDFSRKVLNIVAQIPKGKVMTYSQVAKKAGSPQAYRAVGSILNRNYRAKNWQLPMKEFEPVPCHRVIRSDNFVGEYAKGIKAKEKLLANEGHVIDKHKIHLPDFA